MQVSTIHSFIMSEVECSSVMHRIACQLWSAWCETSHSAHAIAVNQPVRAQIKVRPPVFFANRVTCFAAPKSKAYSKTIRTNNWVIYDDNL